MIPWSTTAAVRADPSFWHKFIGKDAADMQRMSGVDAVSRATLTSLAIIESIGVRLAGPSALRSRVSLRFPGRDPTRRGAAIFTQGAPPRVRCLGFEHRIDWRYLRVGRSGPCRRVDRSDGSSCGDSDRIPGTNGCLARVRCAIRSAGAWTVRRSYDNERYVDYVREDEYFAEQLIGRSLVQLAGLPGGIDGVSGATMTSEAIGQGIALTAARFSVDAEQEETASGVDSAVRRGWGLRGRDVGVIVAIVFALSLTFSRWRGNRRLRWITRIAIVIYLGVLGGGLLSQDLFAGWIASGLPWFTAPGLVLLVAAAFLAPVVTGRQVYCHQLCAHGALQELVRSRSPETPKFASSFGLARTLASAFAWRDPGSRGACPSTVRNEFSVRLHRAVWRLGVADGGMGHLHVGSDESDRCPAQADGLLQDGLSDWGCLGFRSSARCWRSLSAGGRRWPSVVGRRILELPEVSLGYSFRSASIGGARKARKLARMLQPADSTAAPIVVTGMIHSGMSN